MLIQVQESVYEELGLLFGSFLLGNALMAFYGVLMFLRRMIVHGKMAVAWEDALFWMGASISIFWLLFVMNEGNLRFYALAAVAGGMWFHFKLFTKKILAKITIPLYNKRKVRQIRRNHGSKSE